MIQNLRRHRSAAPQRSGDLAPASEGLGSSLESKRNARRMRCTNTVYVLYIYARTRMYMYVYVYICMIRRMCVYTHTHTHTRYMRLTQTAYPQIDFRSIQAASFRQTSPSSSPGASCLTLTESSDEMTRQKT